MKMIILIVYYNDLTFNTYINFYIYMIEKSLFSLFNNSDKIEYYYLLFY